MPVRRFILADFTYVNRVGVRKVYEAGRSYVLPREVAHAAAKRELVAKEQPAGWMLPNMFQFPILLAEAEVIEAKEELRALQRHAFGIVDADVNS